MTEEHFMAGTHTWFRSAKCSYGLTTFYSSCQLFVNCEMAHLLPYLLQHHKNSQTETPQMGSQFSSPLHPRLNYHGSESVIKSLLWPRGSGSL